MATSVNITTSHTPGFEPLPATRPQKFEVGASLTCDLCPLSQCAKDEILPF
jgi:hypothetical protein